MNQQAQRDIARKLKVLNYAKEINNISKTCRYFGICHETTLYIAKKLFSQGRKRFIDSRPCPENRKLRIPKEVEGIIIHLRTHYHFGADLSIWHLQRYHDIKLSQNGCYQVLLRNKLNERSHLTDKREFYQLLEYVDDVDLNKKLAQ